MTDLLETVIEAHGGLERSTGMWFASGTRRPGGSCCAGAGRVDTHRCDRFPTSISVLV